MVDFIDDVYLLVLGGFSVWFLVILWIIVSWMRRINSGSDSSQTELAATKDVKKGH